MNLYEKQRYIIKEAIMAALGKGLLSLGKSIKKNPMTSVGIAGGTAELGSGAMSAAKNISSNKGMHQSIGKSMQGNTGFRTF